MVKGESLDCLVLQLNNQDCFSDEEGVCVGDGGGSKFWGVLGWCCGR